MVKKRQELNLNEANKKKEAKAEKDKPHKLVKQRAGDKKFVSQCPEGHQLTYFKTHHNKFGCNECKRKVYKGVWMYGCRACDFDLCPPCEVKYPRFPELEEELKVESF